MAILAGSKIVAADVALPAQVSAVSSATNSITATAWADLPNSLAASITNPHPTLSLLVQVGYGCWLSALTTTVRSTLRASGGVTVPSGPGAIFQGWGEIPFQAGTPNTVYCQMHATGYLTIPPAVAAVTLTAQAYRDAASGTQSCNYPTIRLTPVRFL